ncbi:aldehyde dehydrogenase family protein [Kocuria rhizophila]|nr:aldehyde dehydrogenase family protein [Kocuria rhizophila]
MDAFKEEIFGPVAGCTPDDSVDEAVHPRDDFPSASGSAWAEDTAKAEEVARRLEAGHGLRQRARHHHAGPRRRCSPLRLRP